ncbi:MAG: AAA family ATPase [Halodesulfovibrio sp.]|uniref:AAA family ATPase n=1 Tax=Halodesulfovibrio sp. TaxID=1912772 RepID=UPI00359CC566
MIKTLELNNVGPSDHLEVEFGERLTVFTGDNGLGKSFILDVAWWMLTKNWSGEVATPPPQKLDLSKHITKDLTITSPPTITGTYQTWIPSPLSVNYEFQDLGQVWQLNEGELSEEQKEKAEGFALASDSIALYIKHNGDVSFYDPAKTRAYTALKERGEYASEIVNSFFPVKNYSVSELWEGVKQGGSQEFNGLISDWGDWYREKDRHYDLLEAGIKHLSPINEPMRLGPLRRVKASDSRKFPTIVTSYDQEVPVIHTSAGVRKILSLLHALVVAWTEHEEVCSQFKIKKAKNLILFVDEVDAHLHPQWQRSIVKSLESVMHDILGNDELATQLIFTTHSPLLLASLEPIFDEEKDKLYTFDLHDGEVELSESLWIRHGTSAAWLTSPAFGLGSDMSVEAEKAIKKAKLAVRNEVSEEEAKKIHTLLVNSLRPTDPFWAFWRSRAENFGWDL